MRTNWKIILLSLVAIFLAGALSLSTWLGQRKIEEKATVVQEQPPAKNLAIFLRSEGRNLKVGESFRVDVFFGGSDADLASVFEAVVDYDPAVFQLKSAEAGGFFAEPLMLSWGKKENLFAFSFNPKFLGNRKEGILPDLPLITFNFVAKAQSPDATIALKPEATSIYLYRQGVFVPETFAADFSVE